MTPSQAATLKKAITALCKAAIADSWKGGGDPSDIPLIETDLECANLRVQSLLTRCTERPIPPTVKEYQDAQG